MSKNWEASIFGCMCGFIPCYCTFCVPCGSCYLHLYAAGEASNGCCVPFCRVWYLWCLGCAINRSRIRFELDIKGSFVEDYYTWVYCYACAGAQEYRELGFSMRPKSIEYYENNNSNNVRPAPIVNPYRNENPSSQLAPYNRNSAYVAAGMVYADQDEVAFVSTEAAFLNNGQTAVVRTQAIVMSNY